MTIFIDSGAFVGVHNKADDNFKMAVEGFSVIENKGWRVVTTDYVVDEVYTRLITKTDYRKTMVFDTFLRTSRMTVERIAPERFIAAQEIFRRYNKDKKWSFTDCTSYVVMKELKIKDIFTFDRNFEEMGFKIL